MRRIATLLGVAALAVVLLYVSRFWIFSLWDRSGLFGQAALRPQGDLLSRWLRGTNAAPFELMIWAVGCFVILTGAQKVYDRTTRSEPTETPPDS